MRKFLLFFFSFLIRMILVAIADYVDKTSTTAKYTDTDYFVFSDAATHVYKGGSPYQRHTYRYTPLVAYICLLNNYIHPVCGKIVWCICDILLGSILWRVLDLINPRSKQSNFYLVAFWLLNPLILALSTRGSNDNTISLLVYITFYFLLKRQYVLAGLFYGLSVHFKIYPIVYSIVFYFYIDCDDILIEQGRRWEAFKKNFITKNRLIFTVVSAGTFLGLTYYFYTVYGYEFLYESYLYHFVRKDHRHNYSVYWYMIYQLYDEQTSSLIAILTFVPQWGLIILAGLLFYYDIFFATFIQTMVFVTFNKVVTGQYYLWYVTLAPLVYVSSDLSRRPFKTLFIVLIYVIGQIPFGYYAFKFEFQGEQTLADIQNWNYIWFAVNCYILVQFINNHRLSVTKHFSEIGNTSKKLKPE